MATAVQDVRFALRMFARQPGFAVVAILTLALGIGATTSLFTVIEAVLLRPLPFADPARLVHFEIRGADGQSFPLPDTDALALRDERSAFEAFAVYVAGGDVALTGRGEPERVVPGDVTDRFFAVLGVPPLLGRTFEAGEDRPSATRSVVLSYAFWQRRFHGDPGVAGTPMILDGRPHTIVGVMPQSFAFPRSDLDLWRVLQIGPAARRGPFYSLGVGRLRPGVTAAQARAAIGPIQAAIKRQYPGPDDWGFAILPLQEHIVGNIRTVLYLLFGAVAFLLLIATANVANLLLARASSRHREIALRGALGAGRGRVAMQLVTESLVLAVLAGIAGLIAAAAGTRALLALAPAGIPRLDEVRMNLPVFGFALGVASLSGLLFGLVPALRASRVPLVESLKEGGRSATGGHRRIQRTLIVAEIALALILSVGAALMIRSVAALGRVDPGFVPERLLTLQIGLPEARYDTPQKITAFYDALQVTLDEAPAVQSAGFAVSLPPDTLTMTDNFTPEGLTLRSDQSAPLGPLLFVDEAYFATMGIPLRAGRAFDARDTLDKPDVVIINETLARQYYRGVNPVGRRLKHGGPERPNGPWMEIVGVVGDVKYSGLDTPPEPAFYLPYRQNPDAYRYAVIRPAADAGAALAAVRAAVRELDADLAIARVRTIEELMSESVAAPRFRTTLVTVFAAIGLLLAAIGIYGVVAYAVAERTRELGVRVALGATSTDVMRLVLGETALLTAAGVAAGLLGAFVVTRLMASLLFGVTPTDAPSFAAIAAVLVATALLASVIPLRRATRVDPMVALRQE